MTAQSANGNSSSSSNLILNIEPKAGADQEQPGNNKDKEKNLQQNSEHEAGEEQTKIEDEKSQKKRKLLDFLEEDNGNLSSMRLMNIIALIAAIVFGGYTLINPKVKDVGIELTNTFLLAAVAPKAVQKFIEKKKMK